MTSSESHELTQIERRARPLLPDSSDTATFVRVAGGRNNRVYRAQLEGASYCVKWYFSGQEGENPRQRAELRFSRYCEQSQAPAPRLISSDLKTHVSVFEWLDGEKLAAAAVDEDCCAQMGEFLQILNRDTALDAAGDLDDAAEACFSLEEHFRCVEARLDRFKEMPIPDALYSRARDLIAQLRPRFESLRREVSGLARDARLAWDVKLRLEDRVLSPSDFGLHNAIRQPNGRLAFFDFEYAGWDDVAKTICDAVLQSHTPLPRSAIPRFAQRLSTIRGDAAANLQRASWLLPLYQIKWCCILLNDFQSGDQQRRAFAATADEETSLSERLKAQLDKASAMVQRLQEESERLL